MTRTLPLLLALAATTVALAGCATRGGSIPYDVADFGPPDSPTGQVTLSAQPLVPTDKLRVNVFQEPDLSGEFVVDPEGQIDFPLVGQLDVGGRTPAETSELIRTRLSESYLRDPQVTVSVVEAAGRMVTVEGAVRRAGVFPIQGPSTLIQSIAMAGGTNPDANPYRVLIFRTIDGERMAAAFDLTSIRKAEAPDPEVYGSDIVVVPGSSSRALWRDALSAIPIVGVFTRF